MDEHSKVLLGMDDYSRELARILRELLAAGSKRDRDRMLKLAQDIEKLAGAGNPDSLPATRGTPRDAQGDGWADFPAGLYPRGNPSRSSCLSRTCPAGSYPTGGATGPATDSASSTG